MAGCCECGTEPSSSSMALQPGVGLGLLYNTPPSLSIPCSVSLFVYSHLYQVCEHVIQPPHFWSSSSSCCIQLSVQHFFWDCGVLHYFYTIKPSYSLAFNKPDKVLFLNYGFSLANKTQYFIKVAYPSVGRVAQSVQRLAMGWTVRGSNRCGARFSAPVQIGPGAHPASCTMGTGSFPGKRTAET